MILTRAGAFFYTGRVAATLRHHSSQCWWACVPPVIVLLGGCSLLQLDRGFSLWRSSPDSESTPDGSLFTSQNGATPAELRFVDLVFDVARADFPLVDHRHSTKIWNHVDELRIRADLVVRLKRNGIRMGVGTSQAWPALRAILEAGDAQLRREQLVARRGQPLVIQLGTIHDDEVIFTYGARGRLTGRTFSAGEKLLVLDYAYHPMLAQSTELRIGFEIRHDRGVMTWENRGGVIRQVPEYDRHVFEELLSSVTLGPQEFLVIGPADRAGNGYLLGSRFMRDESAGLTRETVLFITPKPVQSRVDRLLPGFAPG